MTKKKSVRIINILIMVIKPNKRNPYVDCNAIIEYKKCAEKLIRITNLPWNWHLNFYVNVKTNFKFMRRKNENKIFDVKERATQIFHNEVIHTHTNYTQNILSLDSKKNGFKKFRLSSCQSLETFLKYFSEGGERTNLKLTFLGLGHSTHEGKMEKFSNVERKEREGETKECLWIV